MRAVLGCAGVTLVMLAQVETVAATINLVFDETTTLAAVIGGALILVAVVTRHKAECEVAGIPACPAATRYIRLRAAHGSGLGARHRLELKEVAG
jgi:hypothetical protein